MKPLSLKLQYIVGICGIILSVSLTLLYYMHLQFSKRLENELHKREASIVRNLAEACVEPIITENNVDLQLLINGIKKSEDDIHYIYIVNNKRQIVAHTFDGYFPHELLKLDMPGLKSNIPLIQKLYSEWELLEDVSFAIQQGDFGRVHIGVSQKILLSERRKGILHATPIVALILLFGSAAAWWFASKITKPIITLSDKAKQIADGRLDVVIVGNSHGEISELVSAFNTMASQLKKRTELQQQTERDLRQQQALLENEIAEREVIQEELAAKQNQLETINEQLEERINSALIELRMKDRIMLAQGRQAAMGEMINNIAHQWRQPLNNLGLIIQSIQVDYACGAMTPEKLTVDVEKAMNTIVFMSHTIDDFRNFFNPDSERTTFSVSLSLNKVIAMIEASLSKQGINLIVEHHDGKIEVEGYFNEFNQVILNLLNNAKDALLEQKVANPIISIRIAEENNNAVVRIQDNAGGISEEIIGQIFDPYFTTKEHGKGSGIGLYMSETIIEEHFQGSLTAENVDGGARFTITVPLVHNAFQKSALPRRTQPV